MTGRTNPAATTGLRSRILACAAALAMVWGCAPDGDGQTEMSSTERQRIIVEFALPENAENASSGPVRKAAEQILARLGPEVRKSARIFELVPLLALDADPATIAKLLRMSEVLSIQPDREVKTFGEPTPAMPAGPSATGKR